jgi:voltage-gated potassium channel
VTVFRPWLGARWRFGFGAAAAAAAGVVVTGTLGFMWIESWDPLDALYMTVITLSTVGYQEVHPLSPTGRLFAVFLIGGGVATLGYSFGALAQWITEAPIQRQERRTRRMKNHVIVCGYGRMGQRVVTGLQRHGNEICVIEESTPLVEEAGRQGVGAIQGDATAEETLERAGVRSAAAIVALLPSDADNLSITMTATALRPAIRVIARSEEERSRANLERAGAAAADIISPHSTASRVVIRNLCSSGTHRLLHGITEMTQRGFGAGEITVTAASGLGGRTIAESTLAKERVVLVLAIERAGEGATIAPRGDQRLEEGDTLIVMGDLDDLQALGARIEELTVERL